MEESEYRVKVLALTDNYRIEGYIAHFEDIRLTDFLIEAKAFIAILDADIKDRSGQLVFKSKFLNVQRSKIEIMIPFNDLEPV